MLAAAPLISIAMQTGAGWHTDATHAVYMHIYSFLSNALIGNTCIILTVSLDQRYTIP
jgi:hypothetical protein